MSNGLSGSRMLMDIPHHDGSPLSWCWSDVARMSSVGDPVEDKTVIDKYVFDFDIFTLCSHLRLWAASCRSCQTSALPSSNKTSFGAPIKMLIAHEISREMDSKHNSPSLVAKVMGLDALPTEEPESVFQQKNHSKYYGHSGISSSYWQQDDDVDIQMPHDLHHCLEQSEYKDVYEVFNHSHYDNYTRNESPKTGKHNEKPNKKKMALVREKFIEAKCLSADEKLRQSKRFQDALNMLSTNRDLFINFLQEPNSLISKHRFDSPSVSPSETKRITVLKPSKLLESSLLFGSQKNHTQTTKASDAGHKVAWDTSILGFSPPNWRSVDNPTQPTRIVVLKPSIGKLQDIKALVSPPSLSPRFLSSDEILGESEDDDAEKSRDLNRHRRDDTLLSSVFSNGYIGDESSFHKSESEYVLGNLSDSEVVSPTSRHSWDYIHRVESPFSCSSFGRVSCSPESSVCREAKKRLSERWATVASNRSYVEQPKHVRRRSSTLGEMLALSDPKSSVMSEEGTSKEQEVRVSTSCLFNDLNRDKNVDNSFMNFSRSKSVPVSTMFGDTLNLQVSNEEVNKTDTPKELTRSKSLKTSLKGKVSSFFSRSKKSTKGKARASQSDDKSDRSCQSRSDSAIRGVNGTINEEGLIRDLRASSNITSLPNSNGAEAKGHIIFPESGLSVAKPIWLRSPKDNQDQPSPVTVLEQLFEEDDNITSAPCNVNPQRHGANLLGHSLRSNLIDKSPPIGSISRTLSRDNSYVDKCTDFALPPSSVSSRSAEGKQEWLFYVQSLLSAIGLGDEAQPDSYIARGHSSDSLLDPSLRDRYIDLNEKEITHEGKRRHIRSMRKLVFDCVNTILGDMKKEKDDIVKEILEFDLVNHVWTRMRELFLDEVRCDDVDGNSLVVERVVQKEVVRKGWAEQIKTEIDNIGQEIEEKLLEELVHETVVEFNGGPKIFGKGT